MRLHLNCMVYHPYPRRGLNLRLPTWESIALPTENAVVVYDLQLVWSIDTSKCTTAVYVESYIGVELESSTELLYTAPFSLILLLPFFFDVKLRAWILRMYCLGFQFSWLSRVFVFLVEEDPGYTFITSYKAKSL